MTGNFGGAKCIFSLDFGVTVKEAYKGRVLYRSGRVCAPGLGTCILSHRPRCEAARDLGCAVVRPPLSPLGDCQVRRWEGLPASPGGQ